MKIKKKKKKTMRNIMVKKKQQPDEVYNIKTIKHCELRVVNVGCYLFMSNLFPAFVFENTLLNNKFSKLSTIDTSKLQYFQLQTNRHVH